MNRKAIRIGGATVVAALAIGLGGGVAQAHTAEAAARTTIAATPNQQKAIRDLARALLNSDIKYTAAERAELQSIANQRAAFGKFDGLIKLLKKVPGFAKAVGGKYVDFLKWYNGLPLWVKGPLAAAGVGMDLYGIWQMFH
ncbi:hypothetical protein [Streptomyces sp. NPDC055709]